MTQPAPKAFISHASDDKERFVLDFANRLMDSGVDTWLDQWELAGGASLPDRIFRQGIGESDAVLAVMSKVALTKPWVREEFDVALVRRIEGKIRLIPIVLDEDVDIPVAIAHIFRYDVPQMGVEHVTAEVVRDMFKVSRKPVLGKPPAYMTALPAVRPLDDPIDRAVFAAIIDHFREAPINMISFSNGIGDRVAEQGISYEQCLDSIEALDGQDLIQADRMLGPRWQLKGVPHHVWLEEEARSGVDLAGLTRQMLSDIVSRADSAQTIDWQNYHGAHWRTTLAILNQFEAAGYLTVQEGLKRVYAFNVTALAKRALRAKG